MPDAPKRQVFISYSAQSDESWARRLADGLARHGLRAALKDSAISPDHWQQQIEGQLRESDALVFIITGDEFERPSVFFELGFAKAMGKQAIFVVPGNHDVSWIPSGLRDEELVLKKSPDEIAAAVAATLNAPALPHAPAIARHRSKTGADAGAETGLLIRDVPRLACLLLVDTSGSMAGAPIDELNKAINVFIRSLAEDKLGKRTDLALISFGTDVRIEFNFSTPDAEMRSTLQAAGSTRLGEGLNVALELLREQRAFYRSTGTSYVRPWVILLTDGVPNDSWEQAAFDIREAAINRQLRLVTVGVEGADMETLARIAPPDMPPRKLRGLEFLALFSWLTSSLGYSDQESKILIPPPIDWAIDI